MFARSSSSAPQQSNEALPMSAVQSRETICVQHSEPLASVRPSVVAKKGFDMPAAEAYFTA